MKSHVSLLKSAVLERTFWQDFRENYDQSKFQNVALKCLNLIHPLDLFLCYNRLYHYTEFPVKNPNVELSQP